MDVGLALEVAASSGLVKGQRLALVHQQRVSQHDAHVSLVVLHPRVPAARAAGQDGSGARLETSFLPNAVQDSWQDGEGVFIPRSDTDAC